MLTSGGSTSLGEGFKSSSGHNFEVSHFNTVVTHSAWQSFCHLTGFQSVTARARSVPGSLAAERSFLLISHSPIPFPLLKTNIVAWIF